MNGVSVREAALATAGEYERAERCVYHAEASPVAVEDVLPLLRRMKLRAAAARRAYAEASGAR